MSITIYTNGSITLDGQDAGLGVSQGKYGTEVYVREGPGRAYQALQMPRKRYALSQAGTSPNKNPGRDQFEADLRVVLAGL